MPALWETAVALKLPVFPCLASKKPAIPRHEGGQGYKDASLVPRQIRAMFNQYPASELIGVATGEIAGFDALDLDTARHATARSFLQSVGAPRTRGHQTESGGLHYLFKHHVGLRCSAGTKHRKGVDIRSDGGYIIWWPSAGYAVNPLPIADWPRDWVLRFMAPPPQERHAAPILEPISERRLASIVRKVAMASNGERNNLLFWAACRVGEWINAGDIVRGQGEHLLLSAAIHAGLDEPSARATIASGVNRSPQ